jgi:hypothetical protein
MKYYTNIKIKSNNMKLKKCCAICQNLSWIDYTDFGVTFKAPRCGFLEDYDFNNNRIKNIDYLLLSLVCDKYVEPYLG